MKFLLGYRQISIVISESAEGDYDDYTRARRSGSFYPGDSALLREMVSGMLAAHPGGTAPPKAIIVPHAGYIYSGPVAASAYAQVMSGRDTIRRVVLLGPSHRIPFHGLATSSAGGFTTPLGVVTVDQSAARLLAALSQVQVLDQAHAWEHSLEVQLPFCNWRWETSRWCLWWWAKPAPRK